MAEILRVKIEWTGFIGAPGYTNLYFREFSQGTQDQAAADGAVAKTDTFVTAILPRLPNTVTMHVNNVVDRLEESTGELQGFFNTTTATARIGTGTGQYSAAAGACINWYTSGVRNGRRIRGRTFIVPLAGSALGNDGTLDGTSLNSIKAAADALRSATGNGDLGVWSRPSGPAATDGIWYFADACTVNDKTAILTSRRD